VTSPMAVPRLLTVSVDVLAVIALGLAAGAMLAEGALLVPYWRSLPSQEFLVWYAANASRLVAFFGPLEVAAATFAATAAALACYQRRRGRHLFVGAAMLAVSVLAMFVVYFRDVNASFATATIGLDRVAPELARWARWHWVRTVLGVAAFVAAALGTSDRRASA